MPGVIKINPEVFKDKRDAAAVAWNEALRLFMEDTGFVPGIKVTDAQRKFFQNTGYAEDEDALKKTIVARVATRDTSVSATPEQEEETLRLLDTALALLGKSGDGPTLKAMQDAIRGGGSRGAVAPGAPAEAAVEGAEADAIGGDVRDAMFGSDVATASELRDPHSGRKILDTSSPVSAAWVLARAEAEHGAISTPRRRSPQEVLDGVTDKAFGAIKIPAAIVAGAAAAAYAPKETFEALSTAGALRAGLESLRQAAAIDRVYKGTGDRRDFGIVRALVTSMTEPRKTGQAATGAIAESWHALGTSNTSRYSGAAGLTADAMQGVGGYLTRVGLRKLAGVRPAPKTDSAKSMTETAVSLVTKLAGEKLAPGLSRVPGIDPAVGLLGETAGNYTADLPTLDPESAQQLLKRLDDMELDARTEAILRRDSSPTARGAR